MLAKLQSVLVKVASVASFVSGAATAAAGSLPHYESAILTGAGVAVFMIERYWANIRKAI